MPEEPRTGRCQHCQQTRPLFRHENFLALSIEPDFAWLCARDYSARELAIETDKPFHIEHGLIVFPEHENRTRAFGPDGEITLTLSDQPAA